MVSLMSLWLPILLSAVIVFVASSVIHMTPLWHKSDFPKVPREAELLNALRPFAIAPGDYFIPRAAGMQEMRSPELDRKSTRLNSSHSQISYAVFCLKKKKKRTVRRYRRKQIYS